MSVGIINEDDWLTDVQAAQLAGISRGYVCTLAKQGEIERDRKLGRVVYSRRSIERWKQQPRSPAGGRPRVSEV